MTVTRVSTHSAHLVDTELTSSVAPASADIAWFSAAMQPAAPRSAVPSSGEVSPVLQAASSFQKDAERINRQLQRVSGSVDPQQMMQANRSLSSFYLESMLSAKLVSKAAQSVEKLTSLQ